MGAISTTNRLGNFTYILFSTMSLRNAMYSSGEAIRCQGAGLVQYRADLISTSCAYLSCTVLSVRRLEILGLSPGNHRLCQDYEYQSFLDCIEAERYLLPFGILRNPSGYYIFASHFFFWFLFFFPD